MTTRPFGSCTKEFLWLRVWLDSDRVLRLRFWRFRYLTGATYSTSTPREQQRYVDATGDDLVLDDPEEPPDGGIGTGSPIQMESEADPPETETVAPERAVRRRVGSTREESRAVTVEEPEDEGVDPTGGIQEPMAEDTAVDADVEAETTEDSALLLRAYASHFWTKEEMTVWNALPGEKEYEALRVFFSDRVDEDDKKVLQWRKRRKNFTSKKQKEKHGKILMYHVPRGCSEGAGQEQSEGMGEVAGLQCSDHFG